MLTAKANVGTPRTSMMGVVVVVAGKSAGQRWSCEAEI